MKEPIKPLLPVKPQPPAKSIEKTLLIKSIDDAKYETFTLKSFEELIKKSIPKDIDINSIRFELECETSYGYYDDVTADLTINIYQTELFDNPNYDKAYKKYEKSLEDYKVKYKEYLDLLKKYEIEFEKYKEKRNALRLKRAKDKVKKLEEQLKKD